MKTLHQSLPLLLLLIAGCTGGLPTSGKLPPLDGSQLTNVPVPSVGGAKAEDVAAAAAAVSTATSDSTPGSLVKHDASGNLVGSLSGNATTASFSLGQQGTDLTASGNLQPPGNGNFFNVNVTGNIAISSISAMPAGAEILLRFQGTGAATLNHTPGALELAGNGPFTTTSGDLFKFVSLGPGNWREVYRTVSNDSYVVAGPWPAQVTTSGASYGPYLAGAHMVLDNQNEYNEVTGIFTAKQSGLYSFDGEYTCQLNAAPVAICYAAIFAGGLAYENATTVSGAALLNCLVKVGGSAYLRAGDTVGVKWATTPVGVNLTVTAFQTSYLIVRRIRD